MKGLSYLGLSLKDKTSERFLEGLNFGRSTTLTFPYYEHYISMKSNGWVPAELEEQYAAGMKVWSTSNLPASWLTFLNEAADEREAKGIITPVPPLHIIDFIIQDEDSLREKVEKLLEIDFFELSTIQLEIDLVKRLVDYFLEDSELRAKLKKGCVDFIYTRSGDWVNNYEVINFIETASITNGRIVDFGCGIGHFTNDYAIKGNTVIGVDRQYWDTFFSSSWKDEKAEDTLFIQAELENVPLAGESVDLVVATSVVGHLADNVVTRMVTEACRILKEGGHMMIGPQNTASYFQYRLFKKVGNNFIELSPETLIPISEAEV